MAANRKPLLSDATWPDAVRSELVLVPVGSLEQHGPHLPLFTDTVIAHAVAAAVAERVPGAWVAPPIHYGSSGEHQAFAGTSSIGTDTLRQVLLELVRSMRIWARRVVLVNGHGGNVTALTSAVDQLRVEGHDVAWLPCQPDPARYADAHAGRTETSLMLHLRPGAVRLDLAEAGNTAPLSGLMPYLRAGGVRSVSVNGVLGDPRGASADEGRCLLDSMVDHLVERLTEASVS
jgi:mycofactocin system creatininase family protein